MLVSIRIRNINFDFESDDDSSNIIINEVEKKSYIDKYINKIYKIEIILDDDDDFNEVLENSILELITDLSGWMISEMEYEVINDGIKEIPYTSTATKPINFTAFYKNLLKEKGNKHYPPY